MRDPVASDPRKRTGECPPPAVGYPRVIAGQTHRIDALTQGATSVLAPWPLSTRSFE